MAPSESWFISLQHRDTGLIAAGRLRLLAHWPQISPALYERLRSASCVEQGGGGVVVCAGRPVAPAAYQAVIGGSCVPAVRPAASPWSLPSRKAP